MFGSASLRLKIDLKCPAQLLGSVRVYSCGFIVLWLPPGPGQRSRPRSRQGSRPPYVLNSAEDIMAVPVRSTSALNLTWSSEHLFKRLNAASMLARPTGSCRKDSLYWLEGSKRILLKSDLLRVPVPAKCVGVHHRCTTRLSRGLCKSLRTT